MFSISILTSATSSDETAATDKSVRSLSVVGQCWRSRRLQEVVTSAAPNALSERSWRLPKAPLETAGEIELIAELELRGDLLDRVTPLVKERGGPVDA